MGWIALEWVRDCNLPADADWQVCIPMLWEHQAVCDAVVHAHAGIKVRGAGLRERRPALRTSALGSPLRLTE